jgi:hypothetical protein
VVILEPGGLDAAVQDQVLQQMQKQLCALAPAFALAQMEYGIYSACKGHLSRHCAVLLGDDDCLIRQVFRRTFSCQSCDLSLSIVPFLFHCLVTRVHDLGDTLQPSTPTNPGMHLPKHFGIV